MGLSREHVLAIDDLPRTEVDIPEWKGSVFVRALTGGERDQLERLISGSKTSRAAIAALCCVDDDGRRMFSDEDVEALSAKNGAALERIVTAAMDFNALTEQGIDEAGKD